MAALSAEGAPPLLGRSVASWVAPWVASWLFVLAACSSPDPSTSPALTESAVDAPRLVRVGEVVDGPPGGDALARFRVAFRMPDGTLRSVDREAIAFAPRFGDGAALVDPERRLYAVTPDGMRRMLAAGATGSLAASPSGDRIAYVVATDALGELRMHDGERERTLATGLASIGVLRFVGEWVLFVGGAPGGVAGVWVASPGDEARCLTNCALRTGTRWQDAHVPTPSDPGAFEVEGGAVSWTDASGARHDAQLGEARR